MVAYSEFCIPWLNNKFNNGIHLVLGFNPLKSFCGVFFFSAKTFSLGNFIDFVNYTGKEESYMNSMCSSFSLGWGLNHYILFVSVMGHQ